MSHSKMLHLYKDDDDPVYTYPKTSTIYDLWLGHVYDDRGLKPSIADRLEDGGFHALISAIFRATDYQYDIPKNRTAKPVHDIFKLMEKYNAVRVAYGDARCYWFYIEKMGVHVVKMWGEPDVISTGDFSAEKEQKIMKLIQEMSKPNNSKKEKPTINLIFRSVAGIYADEFEYDNKISLDLEKQYTEGMVEFHERITDSLRNEHSGLHILHGPPGTGKSTYIKYLTSQCQKKFYYMTPDTIANLSEPGALGQFVDYKDGVFIIEEAELLLRSRDEESNQAVSCLLNLTSGILGDILRCHVICTFNCEKERIDEALLRRGRLRSIVEVGKLSVGQCKELGFDVEKATPIADLYNLESGHKKKEKARIGFGKR